MYVRRCHLNPTSAFWHTAVCTMHASLALSSFFLADSARYKFAAIHHDFPQFLVAVLTSYHVYYLYFVYVLAMD